MYNIENYFDYAATCPMEEEILRCYMEYCKKYWGNSSSLHQIGNKANNELEKMRENIMGLLNIDPNIGKIYFTSGGTESDNIALNNLIFHTEDMEERQMISSIEHDAIKNSIRTNQYYSIPVNNKGIVDLNYIKNNIDNVKGVISIMAVNNEIGTIQPIKEIYDIVSNYPYVYFHTDGVQAISKINIDFNKVDMLSSSAHKFYGPKGIGFIYIKNDLFNKVNPVIKGGNHEYGISSGTVNVPAIMSMRDALQFSKYNYVSDRYRNFKEIILNKLDKYIDTINGDIEQSIPSILNISFKNFEGEEIMSYLSMEGYSISTGSACSSNHVDQQNNVSHVLKAIGLTDQQARNSIRISFGYWNTEESVNNLANLIKEYVK